MELIDIIRRSNPPRPWEEGEKIPWHEPAFSRRMLQEHLSQAHDAASRRAATIDRHVAWIHGELLQGRPTRVLDLGCGPGLYTGRLARLGHTCVGIDFSPASIEYARETAAREGLACTYVLQDVRTAAYGADFGLAMFIFGELNVFRPADAEDILRKAWQALAPGGYLLLEPHPFSVVQASGKQPAHWYATASGLFSERPHLCLEESFWDEATETATERYYILDAQTGQVTRYASTMQAYSDRAYRDLLERCGFSGVEFYPALAALPGAPQSDLIAITARKPS